MLLQKGEIGQGITYIKGDPRETFQSGEDILMPSSLHLRIATTGKAGKIWSLRRFWVSIRSYKKQLVKKFLGRILNLALLKFAVVALTLVGD